MHIKYTFSIAIQQIIFSESLFLSENVPAMPHLTGTHFDIDPNCNLASLTLLCAAVFLKYAVFKLNVVILFIYMEPLF